MINRPWLPLNALRAFDAVGQHLSFTAGAQALRVSQSALSRHVLSLEDLLGKKLLERRPQHLVLTEEGAILLPVVRKCFDRLEQVLNTIKDGERASRNLRVHMPPSLLNHMALPILQDFRREFPDIPIDVTSAHVTGLPSTDLDMAIVYDRPKADDKITDLLWMVRVTPVCSPKIAEANGGRGLEELIAENELLHVKLDSEPRAFLWANYLRQCGVHAEPDRGLSFDTSFSAVRYAISGGGVALADVDMFAAELKSGDLVAPYPEAFEEGYGYYLKSYAEDLGDPAVAALRSWLISRFALGRQGAPTARMS